MTLQPARSGQCRNPSSKEKADRQELTRSWTSHPLSLSGQVFKCVIPTVMRLLDVHSARTITAPGTLAGVVADEYCRTVVFRQFKEVRFSTSATALGRG